MSTLLSKLNVNNISFTPIVTKTGRNMVAMKLGSTPFVIQMNNDETDLYRAPFGLDRESELYPDPNNRNLRLMLPDGGTLQKIDEVVMKQYEINHTAWGVASGLEYSPLVQMNEEVGPMVKTKYHGASNH